MEERRQRILKELEKNGSVRVNELSELLGCSKVTIRADIRAMDQEGKLVRTHGGAVEKVKEDDRRYKSETMYRNVEMKKQIAACAYEFIGDLDTILIDDASTTFYLALHIKEHPEKQLAVITNSLPAANELYGCSHVELFVIGGHVGGRVAATMGDHAVENLEKFRVDKAFIGAHGINFDVGVTSIATPQLQVKQKILQISRKVFVLADSTKFGGGYLSVICPLKSIYKIITDSKVSRENVIRAERDNIPLVVGKPNMK